jgi:predicted dienelactone hydrolase
MHRVFPTKLFVWMAVFSAILPMADLARASTTLELVIAGLDVEVWPPNGGPKPYPLVLFSHGLGGCKTQSTYLMRALAQHGMVVVAPDRRDKGDHCPARRPTLAEIQKDLLGPHEYRMEDLQKLRKALPTEPALSGWPIDPDRVVLIGHSLGGYTVLGLAGARPNYCRGRGVGALRRPSPDRWRS